MNITLARHSSLYHLHLLSLVHKASWELHMNTDNQASDPKKIYKKK